VIGRARRDRQRAIDLFGEHHANQPVRPGLHPETERGGGGVRDLRAVAVSAADDEGCVLALVAPARETAGEIERCPRLAAFVAGSTQRP
jgi:hypothetical protein